MTESCCAIIDPALLTGWSAARVCPIDWLTDWLTRPHPSPLPFQYASTRSMNNEKIQYIKPSNTRYFLQIYNQKGPRTVDRSTIYKETTRLNRTRPLWRGKTEHEMWGTLEKTSWYGRMCQTLPDWSCLKTDETNIESEGRRVRDSDPARTGRALCAISVYTPAVYVLRCAEI